MSGLYSLPENPTAADIIQRSIIAHPSLFRESLIKQAEMHDDYSRITTNPRARQGADASRNACLIVYDIVGDQNATAETRATQICDRGTGPAVIALNVAGKLQCLPRHMLTAAAIKLDEGNRA